jgi:diguanylate cyclase (GGDEF)-like protein
MDAQFLEHYLESKKKIVLLIGIIFISIIGVFITIHNYSNNLLINNHQIIHTISDLKYLITRSHLLLEKSKNDKSTDLSPINKYLDTNINNITDLEHNKPVEGFKYDTDYDDQETRNIFLAIKKDLEKLKKSRKDEGKNIHTLFNSLNDDILKLEKHHKNRFEKQYGDYLEIQYTIYGSMAFIILFALYFIGNFNKELENKTLFSHIDKLTNIQNFKGFINEGDKLVYFFERYKTSFSVMVFNIDNFKNINEEHGRKIGNLLLIDISKLVHRKIRKNSDMLFRAQDDNFIILCPNISIDNAILMGKKLQEEIDKKLHPLKGINITISLGITEVQEGDHPAKIYERAKDLVHISKVNGKNNITSDYDMIEEEEEDQQNS